MNKKERKHIRPLHANGTSQEERPQERQALAARGPLAACDCDEDCPVDICVGDDVDVDVCGMYGG